MKTNFALKIFLTLIILFSLYQLGYANPWLDAYIFDPGEYYILADGVRIRSQPNLNGEIIGRLPLNSKIRIISCASERGSAQRIDKIVAYWYLIEYENIKGYIWGGYISAKTLSCDIDNNGIDDYFHYRVSRVEGPGYYQVYAISDVVIYINNKYIPTASITSKYSNGRSYNVWGGASFERSENNTVLIIMFTCADGYIYEDTFEIDGSGKIKFIKRTEEEVVF